MLKFKRFKRFKNLKNDGLIKDSFYMIFSNIYSKGMAYVFYFLTALILGTEGFGTLRGLLPLMDVMTIFFCSGIPPSMAKYISEYQAQIKSLANIVNTVAKYIPGRRKRKLHVGLFGYSRKMDGITLPRAITFTASLYSLGFPPEILGLNAFDKEDIKEIKKVYVNFEQDLRQALKFY